MKSTLPLKKTKIVATIGPASSSQAILEQMMLAGMNIVRINFAHGDLASHRQVIGRVRAAAAATHRRVAIFGDLPGPKMRIGVLKKEPIHLQAGRRFILQTNDIEGDQNRVSISFSKLPQVVKAGDHIFLNDGYIVLQVEAVQENQVITKVLVGGELRSHKGVNLPDIDLGIDAFTEEDRAFLAFAAEQGLDGVSQSFVENARDVDAVRATSHAMGYNPLIIAKIERSRALKNLENILQAADAIMVARGDLGVETPVERVDIVQKEIISRANLLAKPVITATQMLESMIDNPRPTRAEVADVTNAILDGTDAVMLSGETAIGAYPVEVIQMMTRIAQSAEKHMADYGFPSKKQIREHLDQQSQNDQFSLVIDLLTETMHPKLIIVPSMTGATARQVARFRMPQWLIAGSHIKATCQRLQFSWGIYPILVSQKQDWDDEAVRQMSARQWCQDFGVTEGLVILIEGAGTLRAEDTRRVDIVDLG